MCVPGVAAAEDKDGKNGQEAEAVGSVKKRMDENAGVVDGKT